MRPILFDFGVLDLHFMRVPVRIFGYGLMLVLGFLLGIYLAQWRARRSGEDPDRISRCGLLALAGGIIGARAAYIIKYWDEFAASDKGLAGLADFTSGGLIYYGGLILAAALVLIYVRLAELPVRRYIDIVSISLMVGLAFGRAGCLLNGCCFGRPCRADWWLGTKFPMYSRPLVKLGGQGNPFSEGTVGPTPAYIHQLAAEKPVVHPDERLTIMGTAGHLHLPVHLHGQLAGDQLAMMFAGEEKLREHFYALAGEDGKIDRAEWRSGLAAGGGLLRGSEHWDEVAADADTLVDFQAVRTYFAHRKAWLLGKFDTGGPEGLSGDEQTRANEYLQADLFALVDANRSEPVQPAQLLGIINALLIAALLWLFYRIRRREGHVFAMLLILYPITRFVLESIRDDNPHDLAAFVLTHNQYTSGMMMAVGVAMFVVFLRMPPSAGPAWAGRARGQTADKDDSHRPRRRTGHERTGRPTGQRR